MTLTFELSTSNWGHGSPVSWASLMPIFSFLCHSILDLGPGTGQTDDGHQCIMPHTMGRGKNVAAPARRRGQSIWCRNVTVLCLSSGDINHLQSANLFLAHFFLHQKSRSISQIHHDPAPHSGTLLFLQYFWLLLTNFLKTIYTVTISNDHRAHLE